MGESLTYIAIFAFAIPASTIIILVIILAIILLIALLLVSRRRKSKRPASPLGEYGQERGMPPYYPQQQSSLPYTQGPAPQPPDTWFGQGPAPQQPGAWGSQGSVPQQTGALGSRGSVPQQETQAEPASPSENIQAPPVQRSSAPPQRSPTPPQPQRSSAPPQRGPTPPQPQRSSAPPLMLPSGASPPVSTPKPKSSPPVYSPEQLRFTAFHPKEVVAETWKTLLVYAHIEQAVEAIYTDAQRFKAELGATPRKVSVPATQLLLRETNITIVPECKGVVFNPKRFTFKWLEDWHRASFRFQAKPELAGSAGNGRINIFAGPVLIGTLKLALLFEEQDTALPAHSRDMQETATLYKQIFASYSHDDSLIVLTCRDVFKTLGFNTLIDIDTLRSGQKFSDALKRMIDVADIFQLFWSERAAKSPYVAEEWKYALGLNKGEGFVRPVYWEVPMAKPPEKLAPLHFAYLPAHTFTQQQSPSR